MINTLTDALKHRRSYYKIDNRSTISNQEIEQIIEFAVTNTPSAFNSQSTRVVLLLGENHTKLWEIVKNTLKKIVPEEAYLATEAKIDGCFKAGYGTVLFFEDTTVIQGLQSQFPPYADRFPVWSQHTSAMHQLVVWTMLEDAGMGASLQHYNPLIDNEVRATWNLPQTWELVSQMPFGTPVADPDPKTFSPLAERIRVFK